MNEEQGENLTSILLIRGHFDRIWRLKFCNTRFSRRIWHGSERMFDGLLSSQNVINNPSWFTFFRKRH